eukprot:2550399-Pyramimonas_sp.AAC.2
MKSRALQVKKPFEKDALALVPIAPAIILKKPTGDVSGGSARDDGRGPIREWRAQCGARATIQAEERHFRAISWHLRPGGARVERGRCVPASRRGRGGDGRRGHGDGSGQ